MKVVERWKHIDYGTLEAQLTIIDPKVYETPFAGLPLKLMRLPDAEIWEYFCVPTDNDYFNQTHIAPGNQVPVSAIK
jgi:hypothetical protein